MDTALSQTTQCIIMEKETIDLFIKAKTGNLTLYFPGIQFQIQRMGANDSTDVNDRNNPYKDNNIGVEKLLEINSEEEHDDVCLSYVFTYRDFADGVLGLAWVGEAGKVVVY